MLYDSKYMTFQKGQNYGDNKRISGCDGFGWGVVRLWRHDRQYTENRLGNKNILYDTIMIDVCLYTFVLT